MAETLESELLGALNDIRGQSGSYCLKELDTRNNSPLIMAGECVCARVCVCVCVCVCDHVCILCASVHDCICIMVCTCTRVIYYIFCI
jgi:hypothetical protein